MWYKNGMKKRRGKFGAVVLNIAAIIVGAAVVVTLVSALIIIAVFIGSGFMGV